MRFKEVELDRGVASIVRAVVARLPWSAQTYLTRRDWHGVGENGVDEKVYQLL